MVLKRGIHLDDKETILIGKVIARLRRARLMSQEDLAFKSGIDRSFMSKLETNKSEPGLRTTFALANSLGMTPSDLVKIIEESPDTEFGTKKGPYSNLDK
jgi:transcriptional regulator with XRE-family HTH domain